VSNPPIRIEDIMIENEIASPAAAVVFPAVVDPAEAQLVDDVGNLWLVHSQAQSSLQRTRDELRLVRTDLSQRLHALKAVLSGPGRGGAWSSFLASQTIPRSSADVLVRAHQKTISAESNSCAGEQIPEPAEVVVRRYVRALWPKLSRILTTPESIQMFITELRCTAEKSFADKSLSGSLAARGSGIPSYLMKLNLPAPAISDNVANA
jgi:hypothetical protein